MDGEFIVGQRKLHRISLAYLDLPGEPGGDPQSQTVSPFLKCHLHGSTLNLLLSLSTAPREEFEAYSPASSSPFSQFCSLSKFNLCSAAQSSDAIPQHRTILISPFENPPAHTPYSRFFANTPSQPVVWLARTVVNGEDLQSVRRFLINYPVRKSAQQNSVQT